MCFMTWKPHVFSEDSSGYWNMNSGLLRRGTMNQLVYGSSNSFGRMSIMPLEETNWEGGEGIIDHNNPITLHNNTRRSTDWFKCLSRWYADEFWCLSVCPSVGQLIAYRIKYSSWLLHRVETRLHYTSQQVLWGSVGVRVGGSENLGVCGSDSLRIWGSKCLSVWGSEGLWSDSLSAWYSEGLRVWGSESLRVWCSKGLSVWGSESLGIWGSEGLRLWGSESLKVWEYEVLRVWGSEGMKFWESESMRVWGYEVLRAWESEGLRVWGSEGMRFWESESLRVWGYEGLRVWRSEGLRVWGSESLTVWGYEGLRVWGSEGMRVWGSEGLSFWETEGMRVWGYEGLRVWMSEGMRFCESDGLRVWGSEGLSVWGYEVLRVWGTEGMRVWGYEVMRFWRWLPPKKHAYRRTRRHCAFMANPHVGHRTSCLPTTLILSLLAFLLHTLYRIREKDSPHARGVNRDNQLLRRFPGLARFVLLVGAVQSGTQWRERFKSVTVTTWNWDRGNFISRLVRNIHRLFGKQVPSAHVSRASSRLSLCACAVTSSINWEATDAISWNSCYVYVCSCALNMFKTIEGAADCEIGL